MRILHLTPELPHWPGGSGGSTRQFHLLRRLAELGHEVTIVAPVTGAQERALDGVRAAGLSVDPVRRPSSRLREVAAAAARSPALVPRAATLPVLAWQVSVFWAALRPAALAAVERERPDVVSIEHDNAAAWARDLPPGTAAVLTLQNLGWHYYRNRAAAARSDPARAALRFEARRFLRFDAGHLPRYRALVAMSDRDAAELREVTDTPVEVVPNGVDTSAVTPAPEPDAGPPSVLFTGTLSHPPNAEGIGWFVREAWPLVRASEPEATLRIVGRDPPAAVRRLGEADGVEVVGPVPDMAPHLASAHVVVAPLLSGGGTRLKILEALASGRATLSTSIGMEGLDLAHDRELLVADGAEDFAAATLRLLGDRELRARLAAAGRATAAERYDWNGLGDRFAALLERVGQSSGP